jgi:predicted dehydrogenase
MNPPQHEFPRSIAIAGAWGYIGRKFLDVSLSRGLTTFVYDPAPAPDDVDLRRLIRIDREADFYRVSAGIFHLAVRPEHRRLDLLLARREPLLILNEKPMAQPECPEHCREIIEAVDASRAIVLYDFPELFDPLTTRILEYLGRFREVHVQEIFVQRSKDREDPANPRNDKIMVPIQYQETVHCLAFALHLLAALKGSVPAALGGGVRIRGHSDLYAPPNPVAYPYAVDGRCRFQASLGDTRVDGYTDFKRGSAWAKRRVIRGIGDGDPFEIEVSYLEGRKSLRINGVDQPCDPTANSYEQVLATAFRWSRQIERAGLLEGLFPNPRFTRVTHQLSSALWRSCQDQREVSFGSLAELDSWDAGFAQEVARQRATR